MKTRIPDRWLPYQALGQRIPGTRFISFKVPLTDDAFQMMPENIKFTPEMLMKQCPALQFIVDLTNTNRYYNGKVFTDRGLLYKKILTPGHVIPGSKYIKEFFDTVDAFLRMPAEPDSLIGVHCTHGLNRTSYFICCYMIHRMGFEPKDAIEAFEEARGHKIERNLYVEDLLKGGMGAKEETGRMHRGSYRVATPYGRPQGRERRRPSRWGDCAPTPAPYANPYARGYAPTPVPYANPYARVPRHNHNHNNNNHYSNSQTTEKSFGYSNHGRRAPTQPYVFTEYPSSRGRARESAGPNPYKDRQRGRGRGNRSRHQH